MRIFISWSGNRGKKIAKRLKNWLPFINQKFDPWFSEQDIASGSVFIKEINDQLRDSKFGIICLTPESITAPWVLYESGAIANAFDDSKVCPYLIDVRKTELSGPLSQFQACEAIKEDTLKLITDLNKLMGESELSENQLLTTFERFWPDLEGHIKSLPETDQNHEVSKSSDQMLEEILIDVRDIKRNVLSNSPSTQLTRNMQMKPVYVDYSEFGYEISWGFLVRRKDTLNSLLIKIAKRGTNEVDSSLIVSEYGETWVLQSKNTNRLFMYDPDVLLSLEQIGISDEKEVKIVKIIDKTGN